MNQVTLLRIEAIEGLGVELSIELVHGPLGGEHQQGHVPVGHLISQYDPLGDVLLVTLNAELVKVVDADERWDGNGTEHEFFPLFILFILLCRRRIRGGGSGVEVDVTGDDLDSGVTRLEEEAISIIVIIVIVGIIVGGGCRRIGC